MKPHLKLFELSRNANIPLVTTLELTRRCNLACAHCYLDDKTDKAPLTTAQVKKLLRELATAGCLYLVFTGGEIFLRPDIIGLCAYARKLNFDLRLFTNATLLTPTLARALARLNLSGIEVSVYGSAAVHDGVTGVAGSYRRTLASLERLHRAGIPLAIKMPLMKGNFSEIARVRRVARSLGAPLRLDPVIAPSNSGDTRILRHRIGREELSAIFHRIEQPTTPVSTGDALMCSAGRNLAAISADGTVYPCLQLLLPLGNIKRSTLSTIWSGKNPALKKYRSITDKDIDTCKACPKIAFCQRCPGLALLEDGSLTGPSRICCEIAEIQSKRQEKR